MSTPSRHDSEQAPDYDKRSKIALGVAVICGLFVLETVQAHRVAPQAASPFRGPQQARPGDPDTAVAAA